VPVVLTQRSARRATKRTEDMRRQREKGPVVQSIEPVPEDIERKPGRPKAEAKDGKETDNSEPDGLEDARRADGVYEALAAPLEGEKLEDVVEVVRLVVVVVAHQACASEALEEVRLGRAVCAGIELLASRTSLSRDERRCSVSSLGLVFLLGSTQHHGGTTAKTRDNASTKLLPREQHSQDKLCPRK
jgi:hypothetical protein